MARKKKQNQHPALLGWLARLGDEVAKKRKTLDLKQDAFADTIKVSRDTVSAIENGSRSYGIEPLLIVLTGLEKKPERSLFEIASRLDPLDVEAAEALGNLVGVLCSDSKEFRDAAIRLVRGLRKDQIAARSGGKGKRRTA